MPSGEPESVRIALALSGAVALGSFEAGVIHELLAAAGRGAPLAIDLIVGSSAGALVGAAAAKSLVTGASYEALLQHWTKFTLQELTAGYETASQARSRGKPVDRGILSSEAVRLVLQQNLVNDQSGPRFTPAHPAPRVMLVIPMTNLDGLPGLDPKGEPRFAEAVSFRFTLPNPHRLEPRAYSPAVWRRVALVGRASAAFPGAFDPVQVPWSQRLQKPGLVEELWENERLLQHLQNQDPSLQPQMRYADGGILDEEFMERLMSALPQITGGEGEGGPERLVYDPRRCCLFIQPDPVVTTPEVLKAGTPQSWLETFGRTVRLWTLSGSPHTSPNRTVTTNQRLQQLFHFLAGLARRMQEEGFAPSTAEALCEFNHRYRQDQGFMPRSAAPDGQGRAMGLLDSETFGRAIHAFYQWLPDERFDRDLEWLDLLPSGHLKEAHALIRPALLELRSAYLALRCSDPATPNRHQVLLETVHAALAESLGLAQPWIALQTITPNDARQVLKGDGLIHFGGFFAQEYLRHDYQVGRHYAYLWLKQVVPEYLPAAPPTIPQVAEDGISWSLLWRNRAPLWRITGRLAAALLELIGLRPDGAGQFLVRFLGWTLLFSAVHGLILLLEAWFGWIALPPPYGMIHFWLLLGASLFPVVFGLTLMLAFRREAVRRVRERFARRQ